MCRDGSGGPPKGPGVVERPCRKAGKDLEAIPEGREGSGGPPGRPGGVRRSSRRAGRSREAIP